MRNTGLRIGELRSLSLDCLRADEQDNQFLKVPLGKLDSEGLVPLDKKTVRLVNKLDIGTNTQTSPDPLKMLSDVTR